MRRTVPEAERFWKKVRKTPDCWEWMGTKYAHGYGAFRRTGPARMAPITGAHRYSYELNVGPIPPDYVVDHICFNRGCVRPDHLEAVTIKENCRRAADRRMITKRTLEYRLRGLGIDITYVPHRGCWLLTEAAAAALLNLIPAQSIALSEE